MIRFNLNSIRNRSTRCFRLILIDTVTSHGISTY